MPAELTPVRGDDEQQTGGGKRDARDDRPRLAEPELWNLCSDQPDSGEDDEQECDFRQADACLACETKHVLPVPTNGDLSRKH
jgi:hypothetical protein